MIGEETRARCTEVTLGRVTKDCIALYILLMLRSFSVIRVYKVQQSREITAYSLVLSYVRSSIKDDCLEGSAMNAVLKVWYSLSFNIRDPGGGVSVVACSESEGTSLGTSSLLPASAFSSSNTSAATEFLGLHIFQ